MKNIKQADGRPALTTTPVTAPPATTVQLANPEVYRLPKQGQRDPYHGMSRSWYYGAEKTGQLKLIRLRKQEPAKVEEQEQLLAVYRRALA